MPHFKVKAVYDYASPHEDDLSFIQGQIITVTEEEDADWYVGEYIDDSGTKKDGLFPKNFVEKFEPAPPPRPNRASRHKPLETPTTPVQPPTPEIPQETVPVKQEEPEPPKPIAPPVEIPVVTKSHASPKSPPSASTPKSLPSSQTLPPASKLPLASKPTSVAPATKIPPPAVAEKPSSFRDRIAAFNKPAAAPIAPFKPSGGPPSAFIKKPFVAPPPSRNAYVPHPREPVQVKTYRRGEDPEIAERTAQNQENAEKAGLAPTVSAPAADSEDAPKPTSLKERIALLQKQQLEQAQRAQTAHKEKPKKPPPKKRTESHEKKVSTEADGADLEKVQSGETAERGSSDVPRENARHPPARRLSHGMKSPGIMPPNRDLFSDANDADQSGAGETEDAEGTSTSVEDEEEKSRHKGPVAPERTPAAPAQEPEVGDEEDAPEGGEEEEDDEMDAETRRRMELRERMAKMSGGMGMAGMFGAPGGMPMPGGIPKKKKASAPAERKSTDDAEGYSGYSIPQQRIPMIPFPGMSVVRSPDSEKPELAVEKEGENAHPITEERAADEVSDVEDVKPEHPQRTSTEEHRAPPPPQQRPIPPPPPSTERSAPPVPGDRLAVTTAFRPVPHPAVRSPNSGSESDDELTGNASELPIHEAPPPIPAMSPNTLSHQPPSKRSSYFASDVMSQDSPSTPLPEKRASRIPPIPLASPTSPSAQSRPPPPPPPTAAPPSRQSTIDSTNRRPTGGDRSEGETEYEGDYDTDIAPGATHKDALKSHARESSLDESTTAENTSPAIRSPSLPGPVGPPPLPPGAAPRAVPPPPPQQPPSNRLSMDYPRAAPPPIPPPRDTSTIDEDEDYDPYRYAAGISRAAPPPPAIPPPGMPPSMPHDEAAESSDEDELYSSPPPRRSGDRPPPPPPQTPPHQRPAPPPLDRPAPPPPPPDASSIRSIPRKSLDTNRHAAPPSRTSTDQPRPSTDHGYIASDVDLGASTHWWTQPNTPPPAFQNRKDLLIEIDESHSGNAIEKAVYILYIDYSQTLVTALFDANNVSKVKLEQRHDPPPARLRQDQLEEAHTKFGMRIAEDVQSKQNTVVGDGTPQALILELLRPHTKALKPISTRSYGALVYANLANASTLQYDEIRPGDIVTFRNARFQGKHGPMHAKYAIEVGKPDHVGVVVDWDGTKKKVRAWEQGRESRKVKVESFKVGDLRSGEVRVWRVMGRNWVGWDGGS